MKKIILAVFSGSVLFVGCKEIGPAINLSTVVSVDSTWVMTVVPATDLHSVLIEEFTGQDCPNCPAGHASIEAAIAANPGLVNAIAMYPFGPPQDVPPTGHIYDFRDTAGVNIPTLVTGNAISALPSAYIDRVPSSGNIEIDGSGGWAGAISTRLSVPDSVNLAIQSTFNVATMMATITATVVYTHQVTTKQNLSIVVVEDSLTDIQADGSLPAGYNNAYLFTDVYSGTVTAPYAGDPILDTMAVKVAGLAYKRTYTYKPKSYAAILVPNHFRVIAYINSVNGTDNHIMQSAQTNLTGH